MKVKPMGGGVGQFVRPDFVRWSVTWAARKLLDQNH